MPARWQPSKAVLPSAAVAVGVLLSTSAAHATQPSGFEGSLSVGGGVPFGSAQPSFSGGGSDPAGDLVLPNQLNHWFSAEVPLRLALGWRSPYVFVGGTIQYAWTVAATGANAACSPCNGAGSDVVVGPSFDVHILPGSVIDPWIGGALGIESASFSGTFPDEGGIPGWQSTVNAIGWLSTWQVGADVKLADYVRGGPFVGVSFGQFLAADGYHGWASAGLRLVIDSQEK